MDTRGYLRAKRLHLFLPYVWFADSEVTAKKKKKERKGKEKESPSTEAVEAGGPA